MAVEMFDSNGSTLQVVTTSASHGKRIHILTQLLDCVVTSVKFSSAISHVTLILILETTFIKMPKLLYATFGMNLI